MVKRVLIITVGIISLCLGALALLIPILPTSPFAILGLTLIAPQKADKIISRFKQMIKWVKRGFKKAP